jgi:hypothetical protein
MLAPTDHLRRQRLVKRIHALGPRAILELIEELGDGADLDDALERFAALTPGQIRAAGADGFPPVLWRAA